MRIQVASDLHLEHIQRRFPGERLIRPAEADVLVLAGDIHSMEHAVETFADWPVPVLYVLGNHEFYHADIDATIARARAASAGTSVRVLEEDALEIDGVVFVGCSLWTSFDLDPERREAAIAEAAETMPDFQIIRSEGLVFTPAASIARHHKARTFLHDQLRSGHARPRVVVTHHAPHPGSVHARFASSVVNGAFVSDLSALMGKADLWVHGHVHDSFDYVVRGTRIVANPRGYAQNLRSVFRLSDIHWENPSFIPDCVIDL